MRREAMTICLILALSIVVMSYISYLHDSYFVQVYVSSPIDFNNSERPDLNYIALPMNIMKRANIGNVSEYSYVDIIYVIREEEGFFMGESERRFLAPITSLYLDFNIEWNNGTSIGTLRLNDTGTAQVFINGTFWTLGWRTNHYYYDDRESDITFLNNESLVILVVFMGSGFAVTHLVLLMIAQRRKK